MCPPTPHLPDDRESVADASDDDHDPHNATPDEVKTFIVQVDAGHPAKATEKSAGAIPTSASDTSPPDDFQPNAPAATPGSTSYRQPAATPGRLKHPDKPTSAKKVSARSESIDSQPLVQAQAPQKRQAIGTKAAPAVAARKHSAGAGLKVDDAAPQPKSIATAVRKKTPSWAVSLAVHVGLLVLLSFATLANLKQQQDLGLIASVPATEDVEEFTDIQLDAETLEEFSEELPTDFVDPGEAALGDLSADAALSEVSAETGATGTALGELGSLFGEAGSGLADLGEGLGEPAASATFFGAKIEGRRIVFLVDNSGGMQSGGLEALIGELLKSVAAMTPKQQFYVIFYSDTAYPLFYPEPATNFIRPTERNRDALRAWLDTVEVCLGNAIDQGLAAATSIDPDVVYFLTDGRVNTTRDGRKLRMFLESAGRRFTIHTFGMGTGEAGEAAEQLQQIAAANGGTFKAIEITTEHRARAREKNRPYHNKQPGPIWGRSVGPPR